MGKEGGRAVLKKYGRDYFRNLRKKVTSDSLKKSGKKGGLAYIQKYGKKSILKIAKNGGNNFKKRLKTDKKLKEKYRKTFIEKMKKFTRKHRTINGLKVRSKTEQRIANELFSHGIKFEYESISIPTKYGDYEPDFVVNRKTLIEIFGMDTDFYLRKKIPKISEVIRKSHDKKLIVFVDYPHILPKIPDDISNIVTDVHDLIQLIKNEDS